MHGGGHSGGGQGGDGQGGGPGSRSRIVDGRFELLELLGSGGMGSVWRARDLALHRDVALKEVRPPDPALAAADPTASRNLRMRVLREARALARINHPNVVTIHHIVDGEHPAGTRPADGQTADGQTADGQAAGAHPWLVMELLPGHSLQERLDAGPLDCREAARIGRGVLAGLRAAHAAGIHHRDVKPANIMLRPDGTAVLTDFGIAALVDASPLTMTGEFIGSPEYIAPERIRGVADSPAADLWSLGMLLYVSVEGLSPMRRGSTLATLAAVLDDPVPPPRLAGPLGPVLAALLVRDPAARPDGARLDTLLAAAEQGRWPAGSPDPTVLDAPLPPPAPAPGPAAAHATPYPTPYAPTVGAPLPHQGPARGAGPDSARVRRRALAVAGAVVALALVGAGTYLLARENPADPGATVANSGAPGGSGTPGGSRAPHSSAPADRPPESSAPARTSGTPGRGPSPSAPTGPGSRQPSSPAAPPAGPAGTWVAQLHSEPVSSGRSALDSRLRAVRAQVPQALVLRSSDYASLRPGYWVIYAPGPYRSGQAALANCALSGRLTANQCVGRWISHDAADRVYLCSPPASSPKGRCTRP
ncbi:serine/threonine-protein kinase [Streptomyces sp. NPDC091272]|uniref:serine/threonine-protein kinase n=1 Tax=Streptomyces sp. NPDC091272 TaxID=3365981 RepID=UPI003819B2C9